MKIGILTFHRSYNYGALLQAVALRTYIAKLGHDVQFVNYWPTYHKELYSIFKWSRIKNYNYKEKIYYIYDQSRKAGTKWGLVWVFNSFIRKYIHPFENSDLKAQYDIVIYGSDQIWNRRKEWTDKFDEFYLGNNSLKAQRHIAFSASCGELPKDEEVLKLFQKHLKKFHSISTREEYLADMLNGLGIKAISTLDPVFLLTQDQWVKTLRLKRMIKQPYILIYDLLRTFNDKEVEEYAKSKGLKLILITGIKRNKLEPLELPKSIGPWQFMSLIKYADQVFTSSFHGLAFSIIFQKNFVCSYQHSVGRPKSLLSQTNLLDRMVSPDAKSDVFSLVLNTPINYEKTNDLLSELKRTSIEYLQTSIGLKDNV